VSSESAADPSSAGQSLNLADRLDLELPQSSHSRAVEPEGVHEHSLDDIDPFGTVALFNRELAGRRTRDLVRPLRPLILPILLVLACTQEVGVCVAGTEEFRTTVIQLIKARNPVLLVETHEEDRVVDVIASIASDESALRRPRRVMLYSLSKGVHEAGGTGRSQSPDAALGAIGTSNEPTIFVFFDLHHSLGASGRGAEPAVVRALRDAAELCRRGPVPHTVIIVSPGLALPPDLEKIVTVVDLPLPGMTEISRVLEDIVSANAGAIRVDLSVEDRQRLLGAALGLTMSEAENAFARALASDGVIDATDIALVLSEKRQTIRKSGLLEFMPPAETINDIGGLENLKRWLVKRNGSWLEDASGWGLPFPKGILITGVPGCGKSLTAKCSSSLWSLPLLRLDMGRLFSGLVGSSEQNMRSALRLAEAVSPSILWIDEIEKGFGSGGGGGDSGTSQRVFGTFLTWMQEKSKAVFVIATANNIDQLPAEFLRKGRFDEIFFVDLPTLVERIPIWDLHLHRRLQPGLPVSETIVISDELIQEMASSTEGFSGAEIEQAVIAACFDAFSERRPLVPADLHKAVSNTVPLSVTQAEQISRIRTWAADRAVAATASQDRDDYGHDAPADSADVAGWRGGRTIEI
jgi:ATP-dependent 26S proteasome regulatory subunit